MTPIEIVAQTLKDRIKKIKINNPKSNKGLVILKHLEDYEERIPHLLATALQILVTRLNSHSTTVPQGIVKFTETAVNIGTYVAAAANLEDYTTEKHLHIGSCFIGAMVENGYLDLYRDEGYSEHAKKAPYIVAPTEKFSELQKLDTISDDLILLATTHNKIPKIRKMMQGHGRNLLKVTSDYIEEYLLVAIEEDYDWIRAANKMQQQSWKINKKAYEIVERDFYSLIEDIPPRPNIGSKKDVNDAFAALKKADNKVNRDRYNRATKLWNKELEIIVAQSKNLEKELVRKKARELINLDTFYQFVELDYRGRVYYQEPIMNFQGPDMARGLMLFGNGKPITMKGIKALASHLAVCYNETYPIESIPEWADDRYKGILEKQGLESISVDKMTIEDRIQWTLENTDMIIKSCSALNTKAEKPVAFLAACIEWCDCGGDTEYISYLPIPIDGSCNGYQHSAAISKDEITGELVSLVPQDIQEDLYVVAAKELVKRNKDFFDNRPDMRMKHIRKGIAKRAVMTRAYSAGPAAIADNMYSDCYREGYADKYDIDMMHCVELSDSLYKLIADVCPGATKTMKFLQNIASFQLGSFTFYDKDSNVVSRNKKKALHTKKQKLKKIKDPTRDNLLELSAVSKEIDEIEIKCTRGNGTRYIHWYTPSNFYVLYEDYHTRQLDIETTVPGFKNNRGTGRIKCVLQIPTNNPDIRGYQKGIAPNFIHSQDASHMAITAGNWDNSFGAIHDSFSTHACDIEDLSELTRNSFHAMYDEDNYFEIIRDAILDGDETYDQDLPELGKLDIDEVLKAKYFFN